MTETIITISASPSLQVELKVGVQIPPVHITATGGAEPYTYRAYFEGGLFPKGLKFDEVTGILSGTPAESGKFSFYLGATDKNGNGGKSKGDNGWRKFEGEIVSSKTSEIYEKPNIEYVHLEGAVYRDSEGRSVLYANGRHQVELMVRISAKDRNGKSLHFDPNDLASHIRLIDYDTGVPLKFYEKVDFGEETLDKTPTDPIFYTTQKSRFCPQKSTDISKESNPDFKSTLFYISVGNPGESKKIGIRLYLGDDKFIDTTKIGTKVKFADGEPYRPALTPFQVVGKEKIDFSKTQNLRVASKVGPQTEHMWKRRGDFESYATGMHVHHYSIGVPLGLNADINNYHGHYRRAVLAIESAIKDHEFKYWDTHHSNQWYERDGARSPKMVSGSADIVWRYGTAIANYYVDWPRYGYDDDLVWYRYAGPYIPGQRNDYYTLTLEHGNHKTPNTSFENPHHKNCVTISATIADFSEDLPSAFAPENTHHSDGKELSVDVYDIYGNGGRLKITNRDEDDWPGLRINDALL